ncbi:hypothetical protein RRG08_025274 [Elysia crispata]|uniref:Ciliogenesis and planar polarity effector 2 n=1 Tax=Elysia crispata TaxID=231223 RepID=A0AAE1AA26_9GAST|nr:hypothetical protein RRG08_025274 [Elysia crispata]
MLNSSTLLIPNWLNESEGRQILRSLTAIQGGCLRSYGLLERPILPASPAVEDVHYKLAVVGKGGVGKTSTIAHLAGRTVPESHCETAGIQTTKMYWPVKIAHLNKAALMNLTLWDTGEISVKKFDHILPACKSAVDGILFLFSFVDKGSWEEIPHLISRFTDPGDKLAKIVIGTKFDQYAHSEVSQRELRDFEARWEIPILKVCNFTSHDPEEGIMTIIPVLNCICDHLWQRDVMRAEGT